MLVWACIAPHGGELIPELADGNLARMAKTRAAMEELGRRCREAAPETVVVYTPHGLCVEGHVTVSVARHAAGVVDGENDARVGAAFTVDGELALTLAGIAVGHGVPVARAAYTEDGQPAPLVPLDFGALVPLWFIGADWQPQPRVIIACPDRSLPRRQLMDFGLATVEAAEQRNRRVAIVCSADHGHGHAADGPYGYAPLSSSYDRSYCRAVRENALFRLLYWREDWIESALPDSYWQTLMLYGALRRTPLLPELLSYEAPTYFGMACADFRKEG